MNSASVKQIVSEAFDLEPDLRDAFVRRACGADHTLLAEVLSLLDAASNASDAGFLPSRAHAGGADAPTAGDGNGKAVATAHLEAPQQFGRYKVLERIGEGGMGIVYRAEQRVPMRREVVVKVIKLGMDTKLVIARFEAERQALAMMDHPHIAKVYDAGTDERGRPYFVMEYVKGTPIVDYSDRNNLSIRDRLELFTQVCRAIQHAHHKGIIHRDIKPSNILVSTQDGKAFAKVIDFGIAKATSQRLTDRTLFTEHVNMIGTPAYMSPEQADGNIDIDTRTDVYSLGVVLYELLTGQTPFDVQRLKSVALNEIVRIIREEEPPKPSTRISSLTAGLHARGSTTSEPRVAGDGNARYSSQQVVAALAKSRGSTVESLSKLLRGEIDWIVMKALEKTRARRYETPTAFADDIMRFLRGTPILAAPPTLWYRVGKFSSRYKVAIATAAAFVILLLAAAIGTAWGLVQARQALRTAELSRTQAQQAGAEASTQAKLAIAAKLDADRQAKLASKAALLAQARYLVQQAELPDAMSLLVQADQIGLANDDRLQLNEFLKASRSRWTLLARIPTGTRPSEACLVSTAEDGDFVAGANTSRIFVQKLAPDVPVETLTLPLPPTRLLAMKRTANLFVATAFNKMQSYSAHPLQLLKSRTFPSRIRLAETSADSVLIVLDDGTIILLAADTLEPIQSWKWNQLGSVNSSLPRIIGVSPDNRFVVLHTGPWNVPTVVIDRSQSTTYTSIIRVGTIAFDPSNPSQCLTWFAPGRNGGLTDELCSYDLANQGRPGPMIGLNNRDTKDTIQFVHAPEGTVLFGAVGTTRRSEYAGDIGVRYRAMWPFDGDDPEFIACDQTGSTLALSTAHDLLVFTTRDNSAIESRIDDWCSCASSDGVFSFGWNNMLHYQPFALTEKQVVLMPQLLQDSHGSRWYPWGMHATPDASRVAVLEQSSLTGSNTVTDTYGSRRLLLFDTSHGLDSTQSWTIARQIELPDFTGMSGFSNRLVRLSPDGASVIVGMSDGAVIRFNCITGQRLQKWQFQPGYEVSADGTFIAGIPVPGRDLLVYRISDGTLVNTIKDVAGLAGGCFSDDNRMFMLSHGQKRIELFDLGNGASVGTVESQLIPRAWCLQTHRFLGMSAEKTGTGSKLMLANADTGQPLATVSGFADHRNDVAFAQNGSAIYFQRDRWDVEITRFLKISDLQTALKSPSVSTPDASVSIAPTIAPVVAVATSAPSGVVDAADTATLEKFASQEVTVSGHVASAQQTASGGHLNLFLDPAVNGVLVFIRNKSLQRFNDAFGGDFASAIVDKRVLLKGILGTYGGWSDALRGRLQIELTDPAQIKLVGSAPATRGAP